MIARSPWLAALRQRSVSGGATAFGLVAIVWLSLTSMPVSAAITPWWDKAEHVAAYAVVAAMAMWTFRPGWRPAVIILLAGAALGGVMELAQATLRPGVRFAELADWLASALGAACGSVAVALLTAAPGSRMLGSRMLGSRMPGSTVQVSGAQGTAARSIATQRADGPERAP